LWGILGVLAMAGVAAGLASGWARQDERLLAREEDLLLRLRRDGLAATLAQGACHEGRGLVRALRFRLGEIGRLHGEEPTLAEPLGEMARTANELEGLLGRPRLLEAEGVDGGEEAPPVQLGDVLHEVLTRLRPHPALGTCRVEPRFEAGLALRGDAEELGHLLVELVLGAAEATAGTGHVIVRGRRVDQGVELVVEDDGPGADAPRRMGREQAQEGRRPGLTTLGGWAAAVVARRLGGELSLGTAETGGTRVRVRLPRPGTPAAARREGSQPGDAPRESRPAELAS
jgi:two-component system osmolarity sensor histidine kinase EnvZ